MNAKNSNFARSCGSRGRGHVTMLHWVSWISWIIMPSLLAPQSHSATCAQLVAEDTWDKAERKPNGLLLQLLCYQLKDLIPLHPAWIIQWLYPFSLGCGPQQQKEYYCCWFVSMQQLSGEKGNIKKQLIYWSAKEKRSRVGLQWDWRYLQHDLKMQKTWKR